jgi:hypothetical protein
MFQGRFSDDFFGCKNNLNLHIFIKNRQNALCLSKTCNKCHTSYSKVTTVQISAHLAGKCGVIGSVCVFYSPLFYL